MAALPRINLVVTDAFGNIVNGASVSVQNEITLVFPALFSDRAGAFPLSNPFVAASGADAGFHVVAGLYKIVATSGALTRTWRYQAIGTDGVESNYVLVRNPSNQSIANATITKVVLTIEDSDASNVFNTTTYRYTPNAAGIYVANFCSLWLSVLPANTLFGAAVYKNGAELQGFPLGNTGAVAQGNCAMAHSTVAAMNGISDYLECYVYQNQSPAASALLAAAGLRTSFTAARVSA